MSELVPDPVGDPALPPHGVPGRWHNPAGSVVERGSRGEFWKFMGDMRRGGEALRRPALPANHVLDEAAALSSLRAHEDRDSATWLGHACFLLKLEGRTVLTDPYLSPRASPFSFAGPKRYAGTGIGIERLPAIDVIAISHNHYDHLDVPALRRLLERNPRCAIVTAHGCGPLLRKVGFGVVHELDWGEIAHFSGQAAGLTFTAVPAVHFSSRGLTDRNATLWCGFAIAGRKRRVYFAGDTGWGEVFAPAGERFGPFDLGLVPIGAYDPRTIMQAVHANPEEAVAIGQAMRARNLAAMHWGTVALTTEPAFEPPERFIKAAAAAGYDERQTWVMAIGETRAIED